MNELTNGEGVCRTVKAIQGLLNKNLYFLLQKKKKLSNFYLRGKSVIGTSLSLT